DKLRVMVDVDAGRFTVGVFQDVAWARKGIDALKAVGIVTESLSIIAKERPEVRALVEATIGGPAERLTLGATGTVVAKGPIVDAHQGTARDLPKLGVAGTMRRVGFQAHDGRIFDALVARGGVL